MNRLRGKPFNHIQGLRCKGTCSFLNEKGDSVNAQTILHALSAKSENIFHALRAKSTILAEQKRIVAKIEEVFAEIDKMKK